MSELGDMYRDMKRYKQEKRANNRALSAELLRERGYTFKAFNGGAHLVVSAANGVMIDFWPGTGKWIATTPGGHALRSRGVTKLMEHFPPGREGACD